MDLADLPFEVDSWIVGIVEDIESYVGWPLDSAYSLSTYAQGDTIDESSVTNLSALVDYLNSEGITRLNVSWEQMTADNGDSIRAISKLELVRIIDGARLKKLYELIRNTAKKRPLVSLGSNGQLKIGDAVVQFQIGTPSFQMLRLILEDREAREMIWDYSDDDYKSVSHQVDYPGSIRLSRPEHYRSVANYINKRIEDKTRIKKFLLVTTVNVQLNPEFV